MNSFTEREVVTSIEADLQSIADDVDELQFVTGNIDLDSETNDAAESSDALNELNQAIAGTEFEYLKDEEPSESKTSTLQDFYDSDTANLEDPQEGLRERLAKSKAKRAIRKVARIVYRNRRYAGCAPAVARAVRAFAVKRYFSAIRHTWSAAMCIRSKR